MKNNIETIIAILKDKFAEHDIMSKLSKIGTAPAVAAAVVAYWVLFKTHIIANLAGAIIPFIEIGVAIALLAIFVKQVKNRFGKYIPSIAKVKDWKQKFPALFWGITAFVAITVVTKPEMVVKVISFAFSIAVLFFWVEKILKACKAIKEEKGKSGK